MTRYPIECREEAADLFGMLTKRVPAHVPTALHRGWVVAGFGLGMSFGAGKDAERTEAAFNALASVTPQDEDIIAALGVLAAPTEQEAEFAARGLIDRLLGGVGEAGKGAVTQLLVKTLVPVVLKWLTDWLSKGGLEQLIQRLAPVKPAA